ncbi:glycosyltransferase family 4 protein [Macrococcus psychrotolerans]|uniref:Glycosyltransferase family 4 protein n=1 Tax=Macrococcus psychrotolerans TaxID=3039389 RepID=A0AAU6RGI8_9STAP
MKILIVHQFYLNENDPGGSRFNQFVEHWSNLGHEITVVAGTVNYTTGKAPAEYKGKLFVKEKPKKNVTVIRTHVSESYNKSFIGRLWGYFSFNFSSTLAMFRIKSPDVILVSSPPLFVGLTGIFAKYFFRKPLIFEIRDLWPESAIDTGVLKSKLIIKLSYLIEKKCYEAANLINVLTPAFKDKLMSNKNVEPGKIIYIPNGADLDIFNIENRDYSLKEKLGLKDKFIITYTGAHGLANNLKYLLQIAQKIERIDEEIHFLLIGAGMLKNELIDFKNKNNINNVSFIDAQPKKDIPKYINVSDVCLALLKKNDTFKTVYPNKMFDYMSCKKPILIGIDGIARKVVEDDSKSGVYLDQENITKAIDTIIRLKNENDSLTQMGENGYNYVIKNFERKSLSDKYLNYLLKLSNKE